MSGEKPSPGPGNSRRLRSPQDAAAGLFLIAVAAVALWQGAVLSAGSLGQVGPGMLPRALAVATALCGVALVVQSFFADGAGLGRWPLRGPLFVLGGAVAFGLAVRPLGLAVAGPMVVLISAMASHETRWIEALVFGAVMTTFCLLLFKVALGLPIPVAPWAIGY